MDYRAMFLGLVLVLVFFLVLGLVVFRMPWPTVLAVAGVPFVASSLALLVKAKGWNGE